MGNYFASLPYINNGYQPENNNTMDTSIDVKEPVVVPKIPNYLHVVNFSSVLAMNRLQNEYEKDSSVMMKLWNRLNSLYASSFTTDTRNIAEENNQTGSVTPSCERSTIKEECETESGDFVSFRFRFKQPQRFQENCCKRSQDRPRANCLFRRTDSGFEDTPYRYRTQVDLDSSYLTTMIKTVHNQQSCLIKRDKQCRMNSIDGYHKSISFFIDIRDPLKQKPLCEEYKFSACNECDSLFSEDQCSEESFDDDCFEDDDFVVFEEERSDEEDDCGFNFSLNAFTPAELSCSISSNSAVTTCFDISMNTSSISSVNASIKSNSRKPNKEPAVSIQIDVQTSATGDSKTQQESRMFQKTNSSNIDRCISASEVTSVCSTTEKKCRKKVCFQKDEGLVVVYQMRHWDFAYRHARKGPWELAAADRCRFWRRIKEMELILSPILRRKLELMGRK